MKEIEVIYDWVMGVLEEISEDTRIELQKKLTKIQNEHGLTVEGLKILLRLEKLNRMTIMNDKVVFCAEYKGKKLFDIDDKEAEILRENGLCGICEKAADCKKWIILNYGSEENYFVTRNNL